MHLEALPRRNQRRKRKFYHEGHEEHEVKKFKNINVRNLRVLRGDTVFLIQEVRNDAPENLRGLRKFLNMYEACLEHIRREHEEKNRFS